MACTVNITGALGYIGQNGQLARAEVTGTITDCEGCGALLVTIGNAPPVAATFPGPGTWLAVFDSAPAGVVCKTEVSIRAFFEGDACEGAETRLFFDCRPDDEEPDCPSVTVSVAPTGACTEAGRVVVLDVSFVGPEPLVWQWVFGDGQNSAMIFSGGPTQIEHVYPASEAATYEGHITIAPEACAGADFTVDVEPCPPPPPSDCPPRAVRVRVVHYPDLDDKTISVENGLCLAEGDYGLSTDLDGDDYEWFVDGNLTSTGSGLDRALACGEETEVIVVVTVGGCAYAGGVTLIGCPCDGDDVPPDDEPDEDDEDDDNGDDTDDDDDDDNDDNDDNDDDDDDDEVNVPIIDWCWVWFWGNVALFVVTAVFVFVTFCLIGANVWSAIAALGSGGSLSGVWAALTATNIVMMIVSSVLAVVSLVSFILWVLVCALNRMRDIICGVLTLLMSILSALMLVSLVVAVVLWVIGQVGCAVGGFIDVAWFGVLMSITWYLGGFLGCWGIGSLSALRRRRAR